MFPHHPVCKDEGYQKFLTLAVISKAEVDAFTQQPLNTMSEGDAISLSNASLQVTHRDSLNVESSSTASEISQDEIQNARQKGDPGCRLYKGDHLFEPGLENLIYNFEDSSQKVLTPLCDTRTCLSNKNSLYVADWKESSDNERIFFPRKELLSKEESTERSKMLDWSKESSITRKDLIKKASWETENEEVSLAKELLPLEDDPFVIMGESLLECIVKESPIKEVSYFLTQSTGSLIKKNPCFVTEELFFREDNFILTGKAASHEGNMGACTSDKSLFHPSEKSLDGQEECKQGETGSKGILSSHSTRRNCLSPYEAAFNMYETKNSELGPEKHQFQEGDVDLNEVIKGLEQDQQMQQTQIMDLQYDNIFLEKKIKEIEKLLLEEGCVDLGEVMKKVEQDQKKQQTQIMDLYYDNISLETKIKQLEVEIVQQLHFIDTINKLKKNIEDLIEAKDKISVEKSETDSCLKNVQEALSSARDHLEEAGAERKALLLQLEKLKTNYSLLQEKHEAEMEQKIKSTTQCLQMDQTIRRKEQEIQELQHLKQKLEHEVKTATSALHRLREEKENAEKQLLSLQAELQRQKDDRLAERQQLESRYNNLVAQIKILQTESENERAETEKMQQRISAFKIENQELQQQIVKDREQNHFLQLETARWKEQYDKIRESQIVKEQMQYQMIQTLRHKIGIQKEELRKKEEEIEWKMHILGRFLLDMKSMHSDLILKNLHSEEDRFSSPYVQRASQLLSKIRSLLSLTEGLLTCQDMDSTIEYSKKSEMITELGEKMKNFTLKKKTLEKELQKHRESIAAMRELIIHEKASQDQVTEDAGAGQEETGSGTELLDLLRTKMGEYHKQSDDLHCQITKLENHLTLKEEECKRLTGENEKLQGDLGSLTCKVTSYEEIIECADQRLEIASSQISYLEKRNKHLEDLVKKFKMKARKLRQRCWSAFPKAMTEGQDVQKLNGNNVDTKEQKMKYSLYHCQSSKLHVFK
ncbi:cancer-associated gene 1 protein isoform X7 [Mauremys mutica]|uniref:cancer-associated gene 1 protein isoform X7 n=1 Tax=Mauremys mutica TaxID=74926 RepID=UPI001D16F89C|nr:cancer-associated gene 1 protein isoform X7 [Mauremys mutica]